jgi:mannose-6-phosphate isomerase-like protein (cupin superfamily)
MSAGEHHMTTDTNARYLIRRLADIETERGVCGWRKTLVTHGDTPVANVSHLTIDNSRYHYHRQMTEFYYVLSGGGTITLDDEKKPIAAGDLVVIKPGVWHTSDGEMDVLILGVPAGEQTDVWFE